MIYLDVKKQSLHFFQYKPYSFGSKLIKNNSIHAQAMKIRKQYWILNLLTSPDYYSSRPSPCGEYFTFFIIINLYFGF